MRVYLDNCCFNRPFDDQSQMRIRLEAEAKLAIQEKIQSGALELGWSYILDFENDANPLAERKGSISRWRDVATVDISESDEILARAMRFHEKGFRPLDSLHIACAVELGCDLFLTTDDRILKKRELITEIEVQNPVDYFTDRDD